MFLSVAIKLPKYSPDIGLLAYSIICIVDRATIFNCLNVCFSRITLDHRMVEMAIIIIG